MKTIKAEDLNCDGAVLLDVRTPGEYSAERIEGSRLIPLQKLGKEQVAELVRQGGRCVVICRSGGRARRAATQLEEAGHPDVTVLEGGLNAWLTAGKPVERGRGVIPLERQVRIGAGLLVLVGVILGAWLNPWYLALSGFVGCGLIVAGVTDWCGMGFLLARMPWNAGKTDCCGKC